MVKLFLTLLPKDTKIENIKEIFGKNFGIKKATEA
jgi:hypothetical protein